MEIRKKLLFNKRKNIIFIIALTIIIFTIYFSCSINESEQNLLGGDVSSPLKNDTGVSKAWDIQNTFRRVYQLYKDRVVFITTEQSISLPDHPFYEMFNIPRMQKAKGLGSGFIISEDGFICTNFHVIAPNGRVVERVSVIIDEKTYKAEVRGFDEHKDIAILKINPEMKLKPVFFANSDEVEVGDWAIAIGNPFGLSKSFTVGVVSATGRQNLDQNADPSETYIQTDAAINPGNSGGPLINIRGEVVGINRMIFSKSGGYMGIGFAIPINSVKDRLAQLKDQKYFQKGFIGVALQPMTEDIAQKLNWDSPYGAIVENTIPGGPADAAGLEPGDIIYGVNNNPIQSIDDLIKAVEKIGAGNKILLNISRYGKKMKFTITTSSKPYK